MTSHTASYMAGGAQKVAVAAGFTSPVWPTRQTTAKVLVFGLDDGGGANDPHPRRFGRSGRKALALPGLPQTRTLGGLTWTFSIQ